jgi:RimJ/RimL family protein N-acetyltransferase
LTLRRAGVEDSDALAGLFRLVYANSSHPFQTVDRVKSFLADPRNFQIVAEEEGQIVASMAMTYNAWNDSYELGRALTRPEYRRRGLAASLMQEVVDWAAEGGMGDLIFGFPRVRRIVELCASIDPAMVVTGHDAGRNVANGSRETHLIVSGIAKRARFTHVAPALQTLLDWSFLRRIYGVLKLRGTPGVYPKYSFCGEVSPRARSCAGWTCDYTESSCALEIVASDWGTAPTELAPRVEDLLIRFPEVQHVTATVLADKLPMIQALIDCGFQVTAYLPAWHKAGQFRYDCVQLSLPLFARTLSAEEFTDSISTMEVEFQMSPFYQGPKNQFARLVPAA